ncbi:hypothetical protein GWI33_005786 [Rhynchophorus ferrugineus]|uniref:Mos1 transposase HTH domain-containing protein n=1 Tax=Rhynchophorus ferrugineus TaxID=354439 RepID=A0A834IYB5_RHYFE|nr:hypothetical protein GWI33_005786 [Rhynchophorus ferrugineus]
MDKTEFYVLIKHFFLNGKNTVEANSWFDSEFPNTAPGISTIKDWYAKYRRSEMSTEDGFSISKEESDQRAQLQIKQEKFYLRPPVSSTLNLVDFIGLAM